MAISVPLRLSVVTIWSNCQATFQIATKNAYVDPVLIQCKNLIKYVNFRWCLFEYFLYLYIRIESIKHILIFILNFFKDFSNIRNVNFLYFNLLSVSKIHTLRYQISFYFILFYWTKLDIRTNLANENSCLKQDEMYD